MTFGQDVDPFEQTAQMNGLVAFMIQHAESIFQDIAAAPSSVPNSPRKLSPRAAPSNAEETLKPIAVVAASPPKAQVMLNPALAHSNEAVAAPSTSSS
jgi:hypothetical protein